MSNYSKKFLFTLLILFVPYMNSASKAMEEDYEGSSVRAHKVSFVIEDQQKVQSLTKQSTSSQAVNLEDSQSSWTSYLRYPTKLAVQGTYGIIDYAIKHPIPAIATSLLLTTSIVEAAETTVCVGPMWRFWGFHVCMGLFGYHHQS